MSGPREISGADSQPTHSWIIPLYQDENNVHTIVERSLTYLEQIAPAFEIILVNDGSTDRTPEICEELTTIHRRIRLLHHSQNQGYGASLIDGFNAAKASEYIGYTDGDAQYDPCDFLKGVPAAPVTSSVALLGFKTKRADGFYRHVQSRIYHILLNLFFRLKVRDVNCSLKWFPAPAYHLLQLNSRSAFVDAELLLKLRAQGVSFCEIPVKHYARGELAHSLHDGKVYGNTPPEKGFGAKPSVIISTLLDFYSFYAHSPF